MLPNLLTSASPTKPSPTKKINLLVDKNSVGNEFCTFKLLVSKCPNYGRVWWGVRTKSESPNFMCPYLPRGGGKKKYEMKPSYIQKNQQTTQEKIKNIEYKEVKMQDHLADGD